MLGQLHEEAEDEQEMLGLQVMGLMMVDWLDPQKAVYVLTSSKDFVASSRVVVIYVDSRIRDRDGVKTDGDVHLDLAVEVLKGMLSEQRTLSYNNYAPSGELKLVLGDVRKALVTFLSKLNLPDGEETKGWKIKSVMFLVTAARNVSSCRPLVCEVMD